MTFIKKIITLEFFLFVLFLFFSLYDIGNINVPRQGTEGFYLQILKEMFNSDSIITPLYNNQPHFSKPPLQFWISFPFLAMFGNNLTAARLSIFVVSIILIFISSLLTYREINIKLSTHFLLLLSLFGYLKFDRIYMMESLLTLFNGVGLLMFFYFWRNKNNFYLLYSILFLSAGSLIKGPISIAMVGCSLILFFILMRKPKDLYYVVLLLIPVLLISSIWYVFCIYKHGPEFIDYFFWRENIGKLTSKYYSPIVIIQGLILFSIPLIFTLNFNSTKSTLKKFISDPFLIFLACSFAGFWFVWFIPKQRSHHYSMPAFFYFSLLLIFIASQDFNRVKKVYQINLWLILALSFIAFILGIYFKIISLNVVNSCFLIFSVSFLVFNIFSRKHKSINSYLIAFSLSFTFLWYHLIPQFSLPIIGEQASHLLSQFPDQKVGILYRKPYFISQQISNPTIILTPGDAHQAQISGLHQFIIAPKSANLGTANYTEKAEWQIWKRGITFKEAILAINMRNLNSLKDSYVLLHRNNGHIHN